MTKKAKLEDQEMVLKPSTCMHCNQRHLIGALNDRDKVKRFSKDEIFPIVAAIRSDPAMRDQDICNKPWFKMVEDYLLKEHVKSFPSQVRL